MNRVLSIIALLMLTVGAWAEQTVTVKVLPDEDAGTVTYAISEGVCTLTVTPTAGYYLNKGNVTAVKTLDGGSLQTPRRTIPVDEGVLEVEPDANDATKFSFTMPDAAYNVEVTVEFYSGVSFDASTNTLTLNGANITSGDNWAFEYYVPVLTVKLIGTNTITGNAFNFGTQSKPALVFTTDVINPGSLFVSESLVYPEAGENGTTVFYENVLSVKNTQPGILISGTQSDVKVGGVAVTSQNMNDILGDGTVSFTPANVKSGTPAKLTLNGATIDMSQINIDMSQINSYPIESNIENLTVLLIGNNTLKANAKKPYGFQFTNGTNQGTLTFAHAENPDANGFGKLTVNNGAIALGYSIANNDQQGWTLAENSISYAENYLTIGSIQISSDHQSDTTEGGTASYNPTTKTLSLNKYSTTNNIVSSVDNLTIALTGVNSVGTITYSGATAGTLTICKNNASNESLNELTVTSISNYTVNAVDPIKATENVYSDARTYNLWVKGTPVTSKNKDAVADGISFDGDQTLTLSGVNASTDNVPFIMNGLSKLTIHLVGTNTVNCGQQSFLTKNDGENDHQVTFTTDPNAAGKLTVTVLESNDWYTGHSEPTYLNNLAFGSSVNGTEKTITIAAPETTYDLTIGGNAVTNINALDVLGDGKVSFDATANTLTLNAASITGDITSGIGTLIVSLKGASTMSGKFVKSGDGSKLVFTTTDINGKLTMGVAFDGLTAEYRNQLRLTDNVIALPATYGITVAGTDITPANRIDVTGTNIHTGKVIFDGNGTLTLNGAAIEGEIVVDNTAELPEGGLTVYLIGDNTISNTTGNAIRFTGSGSKNLTFKLVEGQVGLLEYTNTAPGFPSEISAFSNFAVSYDSYLTTTIDGNKLTVAVPLPPMVENVGATNNTDFSDNMNSSTNLNNQEIDGILYTMGDESSDPANNGGYNQTTGQMEFTSNMTTTEEDANNAQNMIPGSVEYANKFKGMTGLLTPGVYSILLKGITIIEGEMYLKIGNQTPIRIKDIMKALGGENIAEILATVSETSLMQIYMTIGGGAGAPAMKVNRRIGPKSSVAGGLGGISVQGNSMQAGQGPASSYKSMEPAAVAASISSIGDVHSGYSCNDPDITDLPDNMFVSGGSPAPALRRANVNGTILPEGLTYIDFSGTKITGMEVDRHTDGNPFYRVPDNTFIYMPAGNSVAPGTKNVVIGGICDVVELDGSENAQPFKAKKDFTAAQATLKRTFEAGGADKKATVYLPYAIPQEDANKLGKFYKYDGMTGTFVNMTQVTDGGLKANVPYIFEAKEGGVTDPMVRTVNVIATPGDTDGFKGVYERTEGADGMYCYAGSDDGVHTVGQFVQMTTGSWVPPFRAYMEGSGVPSYAIAWDGVVDEFENTTAVETIETVKTVADKKVADGWWTLNGVRLNAQPKKAGLYVKDGRLVVVR